MQNEKQQGLKDPKNTQMHLYEQLDYSINSHDNIKNESEED